MSFDMSSFTQRMSKGFDSIKQYASEKMGTADETTAFPPEYRLLEEKMDKIKIVYENLLKINRQWTQADIYQPAIQETAVDVMSKINEKLNFNAEAGRSSSRSPVPPKTIQHVAAKISLDGASVLQPPDEFTQALNKYGMAQDKIGDLRVDMDQRIQSKVIRPIATMLDSSFKTAINARKTAAAARLELDAIKTKCKTARPDRLDALQGELSRAEDEFVTAVEDAISSMKALSENPIIIQCLADLVEAQRSYFKQSYEVLNGMIIV